MFQNVDDRARGARVLVTGATGYVAGWLVRRLLEAGAIVHAAVRDPDNTQKIAHLQAMGEELPGSISFFKADLLEPGSYDQAMQGCQVVFHTASPFIHSSKVSDPQKLLIEPALIGTRNVLDGVNRTASVTRVVLTSSVAAISGGPADTAAAGGVMSEAGWNTTSSLENMPYAYSKVLAERAAWQIADAQTRWRLVVINPALVLGAGTAPEQTSGSFDHLLNMANGTYREKMPPAIFGMVDVRDVAEAHFAAGFAPEAEGRHLVSQGDYALAYLADVLKNEYGDRYPFPVDTTPPPGADQMRSDNSKSKQALGLSYRPIEPSVIEMFEQLVEGGQLPRA